MKTRKTAVCTYLYIVVEIWTFKFPMPTWIELFKCVSDPPHHWRHPDVNNRQLLSSQCGL